VSLVSSFLSDQSVECLQLHSNDGEGAGVGLGALEWDRIRYAFHASRKLWDKCANDMLMLALRIEVQEPEAVSLLLNVQLACLNALRLCPENRRFLITKPMHSQSSDLEVITLRCLHFRIAVTEARVKLGGSYQLHSDVMLASWSDEVAAARVAEDLVTSLVTEGYFDCAVSLVVRIIMFFTFFYFLINTRNYTHQLFFFSCALCLVYFA
jgi:hypothetical protein